MTKKMFVFHTSLIYIYDLLYISVNRKRRTIVFILRNTISTPFGYEGEPKTIVAVYRLQKVPVDMTFK